MEIKLGYKVKDNITNFEGVVTARTEYLDQSTSCLVESEKLVDGKPVSAWFEESRLEIVTV